MTPDSQAIRKLPAPALERVFALAGAGGVISAFILIKEINPTESHLFPVCPFNAVTGLSCPGCGGTRGMHALLNGDVLGALDYNAMLVVFVPLMAYVLLSLILLGIRGRGLKFPLQYAPRSIWAFLILMIAFGVLRNLPFYPFTVLAP